MGITRIDGDPPFVIDRALPRALFERAPGNYDLVANPDDPKNPWEFDTQDEAVEVIRREVDDDTIGAFDWRITPKSRLQLEDKP